MCVHVFVCNNIEDFLILLMNCLISYVSKFTTSSFWPLAPFSFGSIGLSYQGNKVMSKPKLRSVCLGCGYFSIRIFITHLLHITHVYGMLSQCLVSALSTH